MSAKKAMQSRNLWRFHPKPFATKELHIKKQTQKTINWMVRILGYHINCRIKSSIYKKQTWKTNKNSNKVSSKNIFLTLNYIRLPFPSYKCKYYFLLEDLVPGARCLVDSDIVILILNQHTILIEQIHRQVCKYNSFLDHTFPSALTRT